MQFPRRYRDPADIEIAAFLSATIAWGRRDLIIRSCEKMFAFMESPADFVLSGKFRLLEKRAKNGRAVIHRTFFEDDLLYLCRGLKRCYDTCGSLERLFVRVGPDVWAGFSLFRETIAEANNGRYSKHVADPASNSACKRLNLALRWLVREGPVDTGLWKSIPPAALFIPLDLHVGRVARQLGLLDPGRKANDKKAVFSLTEKLRDFCPEDPVKYDLALFSMGID